MVGPKGAAYPDTRASRSGIRYPAVVVEEAKYNMATKKGTHVYHHMGQISSTGKEILRANAPVGPASCRSGKGFLVVE
jgi:hypothetical protein